MRVTSSVFTKALDAARADDNLGICVSCGAEQGGVEPDARRVTCEDCGRDDVYGAEEIILTGAVVK